MSLGFGAIWIVVDMDVTALRGCSYDREIAMFFCLFPLSHQPSVGIDLSVKIDRNALLTYTSNVYITLENL